MCLILSTSQPPPQPLNRAGGTARYWNKVRQRYWRSLARYCSILRVSGDRAANRAAHTRAKAAVLDLQRRGFCETRTVRWSGMDSNYQFRAR